MNCPSRTEEIPEHDGQNQNPQSLSNDLTTNQDLNGLCNKRRERGLGLRTDVEKMQDEGMPQPVVNPLDLGVSKSGVGEEVRACGGDLEKVPKTESASLAGSSTLVPSTVKDDGPWKRSGMVLRKFVSFLGPGFMISVAYIDPGNYSTGVAAGASKRFQLLFIVLMSNVFAVVLQTLAVRLGTVTGMNLAEMCRAHLPFWLNVFLYIMAEVAIIATDIAEVIGTAIALDLLFKIPLVAGCAISIVEVLIILLFYNEHGSMRQLRAFEIFISALVLGVVICFCVQLSLIESVAVGEVFRGYMPSSGVVQGKGIYLSAGIIGATVMVHSLYLGSGLPKSRLLAVDERINPGIAAAYRSNCAHSTKVQYTPSLAAIKSCLNYSIIELIFSLCLFALFVNSAILITAGASLSTIASAQNADLFSIHDLLASSIAPVAGTIFALALLLSGLSAGIIATIAGQMVSEGALNWTMAPWLRRLLTRSISITPSIIIAGAVGRSGLSTALNATQVALSVILPFASAPLIYFTARNKFMTVRTSRRADGLDGVADDEEDGEERRGDIGEGVKMRNHWALTAGATVIWAIIAVMNIALLVMVGLGKA